MLGSVWGVGFGIDCHIDSLLRHSVFSLAPILWSVNLAVVCPCGSTSARPLQPATDLQLVSSSLVCMVCQSIVHLVQFSVVICSLWSPICHRLFTVPARERANKCTAHNFRLVNFLANLSLACPPLWQSSP